MISYYKLSGFVFSVEGNGKVVQIIKDEISSIKVNYDDSKLDFEFKFVEKLPQIRNYSRFGDLKLNENVIEINQRNIIYQLYERKALIKIPIVSRTWSLTRFIKKFKDWNYLSKEEKVAKTFMYNIFDYISSIKLLEKYSVYLHASTFEKNDKCVALIAWGGVGKTTSLLKLITEKNWNYLSDDLGLIDIEGQIFRTPKKLQIYAYNTIGQPEIYVLLRNNMSMLNKLSWQIRLFKSGPNKVRRRISAESLFGESNVSHSSKLTDIFFLDRSDVEEFHMIDLSKEDLIKRTISILFNELQPLTDIMIAIKSANINTVIPTMDEFENKASNILNHAFNGLHPKLIKIPIDATPDELQGFIASNLN